MKRSSLGRFGRGVNRLGLNFLLIGIVLFIVDVLLTYLGIYSGMDIVATLATVFLIFGLVLILLWGKRTPERTV